MKLIKGFIELFSAQEDRTMKVIVAAKTLLGVLRVDLKEEEILVISSIYHESRKTKIRDSEIYRVVNDCAIESMGLEFSKRRIDLMLKSLRDREIIDIIDECYVVSDRWTVVF